MTNEPIMYLLENNIICQGVIGIGFLIGVWFFVMILAGAAQDIVSPVPSYGPSQQQRLDAMSRDAAIIEAAAIASERGSGRERGDNSAHGEPLTVRYDPGGDYSTWRHAKWLNDTHPGIVINPRDIEASDAARQSKTQDGRVSYSWDEKKGKYVRDNR